MVPMFYLQEDKILDYGWQYTWVYVFLSYTSNNMLTMIFIFLLCMQSSP